MNFMYYFLIMYFKVFPVLGCWGAGVVRVGILVLAMFFGILFEIGCNGLWIVLGWFGFICFIVFFDILFAVRDPRVLCLLRNRLLVQFFGIFLDL